MLLARKGYKFLVVARSTFPSDTLSTHVVRPRRSLDQRIPEQGHHFAAGQCLAGWR
jgi:hypothetical protein